MLMEVEHQLDNAVLNESDWYAKNREKIRDAIKYLGDHKFARLPADFRKEEPPTLPGERPPWDIYFMLQAEVAKLRSNCLTRHVGAVIAKERRQIATGYNGTPSGIRNCFDGGCERCADRMVGKMVAGAGLERCVCNHAESNAILQCAVLGSSSKGSTIYCTFTPCLECTKMIITAGVVRVVALEQYAENATGLLKEAGVEFVKMERSELDKWKGE